MTGLRMRERPDDDSTEPRHYAIFSEFCLCFPCNRCPSLFPGFASFKSCCSAPKRRVETYRAVKYLARVPEAGKLRGAGPPQGSGALNIAKP